MYYALIDTNTGSIENDKKYIKLAAHANTVALKEIIARCLHGQSDEDRFKINKVRIGLNVEAKSDSEGGGER